MLALEEGIGRFLAHCQYERGLSDKTIKAYALDLRQFCEQMRRLGHGPLVCDADRQAIREYLKVLFGKYKPRSIKRKIASLKAFFGWLEYEDEIPASPFHKLRIKVDRAKELPKTMSLDTVERLFAAAEAARDLAVGRDREEAQRDLALLELLFATGMRVSEACSVRRQDLDLDEGSVRVMGKGRRERLVPICGERALAALREYAALRRLRNGLPAFFLGPSGSQVSTQHVRALLKRLTSAAGITQHVTPHMFRHTIATMLLENGVDIRNIQSLLGHSSISVTEIYVQVNERAQREIIGGGMPR